MDKKLAIMGSDICLESIANYVKNTYITFIADNPNSYVFEKAKLLNVDCKYIPREEMASFFAVQDFDLIAIVNYAGNLSEDIITSGKFINIHPSLLPAFREKDAMQMAFLAGVKVSGVTVHWVTTDLDGGKIIAQYPVLIGNSTHFDQFRGEMIQLEKLLYPVVIDSLLNDRVFDFSDLMGGCGGSCHSCGNCHK